MSAPFRHPLSRRAFLASTVGAAGSLSLGLGGSAWPGPRDPRRPGSAGSAYALVLGSAQDGGMPQAGCFTPACDRARATDPPRLVASLGLVTRSAPEASPGFYLVDASPDLPRQMDMLASEEPAFRVRSDARRPFDGIFLTHAHMGHYLGLAHLGREALATAPTPVHCTERMADFLATNAPWSLLVDEGRLDLRPLAPGRLRRIDDALSAWCMPVPHRDEFSDTVAWFFEGPERSLLYLPDIDRWNRWERDVAEVVSTVDVALLDGSFYSADEVPGRAVEDIPHPLIPDSMARLRDVASRTRVVFTHLNNSNPALDPDGPEARAVRTAGFGIAREGMSLIL
ncbi:MAG TPA: MBL fold metallo-hydrolase [Longimicrobiales bacterium]|nr:MBL fold metallo-hydrolase [Longimicrobiales bacterium]